MVLTPQIQTMCLPCRQRIILAWVTICLLSFLSSCQPDEPRNAGPRLGDISKTEFMGFRIPVYPTARKQLTYAKSRIANTKEKEAALKLVLNRFPQNTYTAALARLDLAYLALGTDYRLADHAAYRQALAQYHQITRTYASLPGVCAKAYWYMAWIYTDLIGDKKRGMALYQQVASQFASEQITTESPASWLQLIYPDRPDQAHVTNNRQHDSWSELALLEVAKNDDDPTHRRQALMTLWSQKPIGSATGLALLSILRSSYFNADEDETVLRIARRYIHRKSVTGNKRLTRDIETALDQYRPGDPGN